MQTPAPPATVRVVRIDSDSAGQRIDNFLITQLKGVPKSRIYRLLRKGEVRVNKGRIKADYKLAFGDNVRIPPVRVAESAPAVVPGGKVLALVQGAILFENDDFLAMNKPTGMAVHGGSGVSLGLIEVLRHLYGSRRLELVHRIDRETSGLLLVAKRRPALRDLQDQFREGSIDKRYLTLVAGNWPRHANRVEAPLLKNQLSSGERIVVVSADGKPSTTEFRVLARYPGATLLEARLLTGRTHQIRVHTRYSGHPIVGDEKYGDADSNRAMRVYGVTRLFLHAASMEFRPPGGGERMRIEAPLADDLQAALTHLEPGKL
ncbi:23S rRNA pseudouridine(955/2504/2580) synthase RluC [Gilvimarinus sp. F26214L]|uniref:23S rRNA pseudouridine(955/2504/2580) synthase RluC n=1 Tax=Gilvimarinus sp. DZF01 TaxID=3461371 RepID=UPI0040465ECD